MFCRFCFQFLLFNDTLCSKNIQMGCQTIQKKIIFINCVTFTKWLWSNFCCLQCSCVDFLFMEMEKYYLFFVVNFPSSSTGNHCYGFFWFMYFLKQWHKKFFFFFKILKNNNKKNNHKKKKISHEIWARASMA